MAGIVYALTNDGVHDEQGNVLVKIGMVESGVEAQDLQGRIDSLYNGVSGVPFKFRVHHAVSVEAPREAEKRLHELFGEHRVNPRREFFRVPPDRVVIAMDLLLTKGMQQVRVDVPPASENDSEANDRRGRRENFRFSRLQIPMGAVLTFMRDSRITATVAADRRVMLGDERMSLSRAAEKILTERFNAPGPRSGLWYWEYDGELLIERRDRMEREGEENDEGGGE